MLFRRLAFAVALLFAALGSQLPEFTQQYRQRLGGALDELSAALARFDADAGSQQLSREQGVARLKGNPDALAQARGDDVEQMQTRRDRLDRQAQALAVAGPVSQYAVLADGFDGQVARRAYADFQPAIPVTPAGFVAGGVAFVLGWGLTRLVALPVRRRRPAGERTA